MSYNRPNDHYGLIGIAIAIVLGTWLLIQMVKSIADYLAQMFVSIGKMFHGFLQMAVSLGIILAIVAIAVALIWAAFYCLYKYVMAVRSITDFRAEFYQYQKETDSFLKEKLQAHSLKLEKYDKMYFDFYAFLKEYKKPPVVIMPEPIAVKDENTSVAEDRKTQEFTAQSNSTSDIIMTHQL